MGYLDSIRAFSDIQLVFCILSFWQFDDNHSYNSWSKDNGDKNLVLMLCHQKIILGVSIWGWI